MVLIGRKEQTRILPKFTLGLGSPNPNSYTSMEDYLPFHSGNRPFPSILTPSVLHNEISVPFHSIFHSIQCVLLFGSLSNPFPNQQNTWHSKFHYFPYWWIARDVIALLAKPLDVKIADQRYVNACKNTDNEDIERIFRLWKSWFFVILKLNAR